jgi:hypothetical protein
MTGRPLEYKDTYPQLVFDLMKEGKKGAYIHAALGVSRKTFYVWCKRYPEFLDAYERGWEECEKWWEEEGRRMILTKDERGFKPWKEFMTKNFGWGKNENAQTGTQININSMTVNNGQTKEELIAYIQESLKELPILDVQFTASAIEELELVQIQDSKKGK